MALLSSSSGFSFTDDDNRSCSFSQASTVRISNVVPERRGRMQQIHKDGLAGDITNESDALDVLSAFARALQLHQVYAFLATLEALAIASPNQRMDIFTNFLNRTRPSLDVLLRTRAQDALNFLVDFERGVFWNLLEENNLTTTLFFAAGSTVGTVGGTLATRTTVPLNYSGETGVTIASTRTMVRSSIPDTIQNNEAASSLSTLTRSSIGSSEVPAEEDGSSDVPAQEDGSSEVPAQEDGSSEVQAQEDGSSEVPAQEDGSNV